MMYNNEYARMLRHRKAMTAGQQNDATCREI